MRHFKGPRKLAARRAARRAGQRRGANRNTLNLFHGDEAYPDSEPASSFVQT